LTVLIVKTSALGDIVHALPAVAAFRRARPEVGLDWLVVERWAPLLRDQPLIDRVVAVDTRIARRSPFSAQARVSFWAPLKAARQSRYQAAVDLQRLIKSAVLTLLARPQKAVGFAWSSCREGPTLPRPPFLRVDPRARASLASKVDLPRDYAVVLAGGGFGTKLWPQAHWLELIPRLGRKVPVVLPWWGALEKAGAEEGARVGGMTIPEPSLPELMALLAGARLTVGGDTGPLHLAAALGSPTLSLYGPTLAARNAPPGQAAIQSPVDCAGCVKRRCPKGQADCMAAIGPEEVISAAERALEGKAAD
jgi:heptosyltransferase-1